MSQWTDHNSRDNPRRRAPTGSIEATGLLAVAIRVAGGGALDRVGQALPRVARGVLGVFPGEARLADACLTGQQHHARSPLSGLAQQRCEHTVLSLTARLSERAEAFEVVSPPDRPSGITLLRGPTWIPHVSSSPSQRRVVASLRNGAIRISPHFSNTPEEIDRIVDLLLA